MFSSLSWADSVSPLLCVSTLGMFILNKLVLVYAFGFKPVLCFTTNVLYVWYKLSHHGHDSN